MKIPFVISTLLLLALFQLSAQVYPICGTTEQEGFLKSKQPAYLLDQEAYEKNYRRYLTKASSTTSNRSAMPFIFPVVIHIVHDCAPIGTTTNPADNTIQQVIDKTTKRFRHTHEAAQVYANPSYGADTEIEFCLAKVDPSGRYTNGIIRHVDAANSRGESTTLATYFADNYRWDATQYLNIFLVADTDVAGVYLGGSDRDFIIINAASFWDGLLAHELGHYFSLKHVFSPETANTCSENTDCLTQGDFVCDTPPKNVAGVNGGSCQIPANSCNTDANDLSDNNPYRPTNLGGIGDQPDMLANYMDYTGSCWDAFTQGQKERMHFNIMERRMSLVTAATTTCQVRPPDFEVAIEQADISQLPCSSDWQPILGIRNNGIQTITTLTATFTVGEQVFTFSPIMELAPDTTLFLELPTVELAAGASELSISISAPNGVEDAYANNNFYCQDLYIAGANGQEEVINETFVTCQYPANFQLNNASTVAWNIGQANAALSDCTACFAMIQAFSTQVQTASLCVSKMDFSNYTAAQLQFTIGYIPRYTYITNTLTVYASSECGDPTAIYSAGGLSLATNSPPAYSENEALQMANCNSLKTIEIDLSEFAGQSSIQICFEAEGRWYSPLVLDDIVLIPSILPISNPTDNTPTDTVPTIDSLPSIATVDTIVQIDMDTISGNTTVVTTPTDSNCQTIEFTKEVITCDGQRIEGYLGPGTFRDTFPSTTACDSVRILTIIVSAERVVTRVQETICEGSSHEGRTQKGAYVDLFTADNGCDSIRILDLSIHPIIRTNINRTICAGTAYQGYDTPGTYTDTFLAASGCDSIRVLKLTVESAADCLTTSTYLATATPLLHLFPNPAADVFYIDWQGDESLRYAVFKVAGRLVQEEQGLESMAVVGVGNWGSGVYLVRFWSEEGVFVRKVLVE